MMRPREAPQGVAGGDGAERELEILPCVRECGDGPPHGPRADLERGETLSDSHGSLPIRCIGQFVEPDI